MVWVCGIDASNALLFIMVELIIIQLSILVNILCLQKMTHFINLYIKLTFLFQWH